MGYLDYSDENFEFLLSMMKRLLINKNSVFKAMDEIINHVKQRYNINDDYGAFLVARIASGSFMEEDIATKTLRKYGINPNLLEKHYEWLHIFSECERVIDEKDMWNKFKKGGIKWLN